MPARHAALLVTAALAMAGCSTDIHTAQNALPADAGAGATQLAATKDATDTINAATGTPGVAVARAAPSGTAAALQTAAAGAPAITGVGFAQVSTQPGRTLNEKRLMAIKAARIEALADLTGKVNGIHLVGGATVQNAVLKNAQLRTAVDGTLRGARTLKITPKGRDNYEVEMVIDRDVLGYMLRVVQQGRG